MLVTMESPGFVVDGHRAVQADWHDGKIGGPSSIAGGPGLKGIVQPRWGLDGTLFFPSDRTEHRQLYYLGKGVVKAQPLILKGLEDADFSGV